MFKRFGSQPEIVGGRFLYSIGLDKLSLTFH
jgi:hypothetical protein